MSKQKLDEIRAALRKKEREELEFLALAYAKSHIYACELTEQLHGEHAEEPHGHASEEEIRKRIMARPTDDLIEMLAGSTLIIEQ